MPGRPYWLASLASFIIVAAVIRVTNGIRTPEDSRIKAWLTKSLTPNTVIISKKQLIEQRRDQVSEYIDSDVTVVSHTAPSGATFEVTLKVTLKNYPSRITGAASDVAGEVTATVPDVQIKDLVTYGPGETLYCYVPEELNVSVKIGKTTLSGKGTKTFADFKNAMTNVLWNFIDIKVIPR